MTLVEKIVAWTFYGFILLFFLWILIAFIWNSFEFLKKLPGNVMHFLRERRNRKELLKRSRWISIMHKNKYGLARDYEFKILPVFDLVLPFPINSAEGATFVRYKGQWNLINREGETTYLFDNEFHRKMTPLYDNIYNLISEHSKYGLVKMLTFLYHISLQKWMYVSIKTSNSKSAVLSWLKISEELEKCLKRVENVKTSGVGWNEDLPGLSITASYIHNKEYLKELDCKLELYIKKLDEYLDTFRNESK